MSDQLMDARLRAAGERWRADDTTDPGAPDDSVDVEALAAPARPRRWFASSAGAGIAAAVVIVAILITGVIAVTYRDGDRNGTAAGVPKQLAGVTWTLGGHPLISLVFLPGAVRRYDGCSNGLYRLRVQSDQMTLGSSIGPMSGCADGSPSPVVTNFNRIASGTFRWSATGARLTLTKPGAGTLVLTNDGRRAPSIVGTQWRLAQIIGTGTASVSVPPAGARLSISSTGRFEADDGCNTLSSHATTHLDSFVLGRVYETAQGCVDPKIEAASTVIDRVLSGTVPFEIRGNELVIAKGASGLLVYSVAPQALASITALTEHSWVLRSTGSTSGASSSSTAAVGHSRLTFDGKGGFTVQHTCYTNQGTVTATAHSVRVTGVTLKIAVPCTSNAETAAGQRENAAVDTLLTGTVTWSVNGGRLILTKANRTLTFASP